MARKVIFDKKNVLVIGGAGFIGSHLCDELIKTSKVICIDNYASGSVQNIEHLLQHPNFVFLRHDITEPIDLESLPDTEIFQVRFQGIQEVYNMACPTYQMGFEGYAVATAQANSVGVVNSLEIAKKYNAKFLFGSTRAVYGDPLDGQESFQEDYWGFVDPMSERACYNEGKRFGETLTSTYHLAYGMDTKIARIFNTYGPRMALRSGRQIPDLVKAALDQQDLEVLGDGTEEDSYCYVSDMVQGIVALMQSNTNDPVNLGNPETHKIITVAQYIIDLTASKSNLLFGDAVKGLVRFSPPDISRAKRYLGWFPVTDLRSGLERTVDNMKGSRVLSYSSLVDESAAKNSMASGLSPAPEPTHEQESES
ncbi:MAG: NAD-dependent dehydratase [Candidatus Kerfeldbacteria bacterium CG15_BIG_FIL_POST_REV_8_21_14_020_45_12]|uniref:UDP-glucuronate decarboxylase n=1 Tax=Candidatus Kerfeldbacteria bacterium CG15_BIG_FIL_POST_REV_8_21_14_020_45_12 TaxID=2014247 RepID=A0A2M7H3H5_9BACT|nr:MAG: NAD-dependent dehydratase [Candidatus Kerfeldbacteria bacterium CG15_BIG_FIL_POST_REV_8_21_14_020_45_12]PJA93822.1 MAG: NAD-dependent dehydratase [Candidatus Kerfeldbacteria bacterium CG_4_9_14_3_um_filter_45_8]